MLNAVDELIAVPFSSREQSDQQRIVQQDRPQPFDDLPWLTTSTTNRRFYCWPCLLFQPPGRSTQTGIPDVDMVRQWAHGHSVDQGHVQATFDLQIFLHRTARAALPDPKAVRRLADVVCSLAAMHRPPDAQNCLDMMELLSKYDGVGKRFSDDAIRWLIDTPDVVRRVLDAVASATRHSLARDLLSSRFVSLILTRHADKKMSSILRYVANGKVLERFVGFGTSSVEDHVKSVLGEFGIASKCVALSLGGAVLPCCEWDALRGALKEVAPLCRLVPWHGHPLDAILQQSLSFDPTCDRFFKWLADLESFFCENPKLCAQFYKFMPEFIPALNRFIFHPGKVRRSEFTNTEFLTYVQQSYRHFVLFFESLEKNCKAWEDSILVKAVGFQDWLQDPSTIFFLKVFAQIFAVASTLKGKLLQRTLPEITRELDALCVKDVLINVDPNLFMNFKELFKRHVLEEIEPRYDDLETLRFCDLFEFSEEGWFERSEDLFRNLEDCYDLKWNRSQAMAEMEVLRQQGAFSKTSVRDFHEYLHESNLRHTFRSLFEASELILALPFLRVDLPSMSNLIEKWLDHESAIVFVEIDYLFEIKQLPNFHEDVFAALASSWMSI